MDIIHAFQPSTQSHPQIKRIFGSASEVDPLRLKKKRGKMFHVEQNQRGNNTRNPKQSHHFVKIKLDTQHPIPQPISPCLPPSKNQQHQKNVPRGTMPQRSPHSSRSA